MKSVKKPVEPEFFGYKHRILEDLETNFEDFMDEVDSAIEEQKERDAFDVNIEELSELIKKERARFWDAFKKDLKYLEIQDADELEDEEVDNVLDTLSFSHNCSADTIERLKVHIESAGYYTFKSDSILTDQKIEAFLERLKQQPY
jgi:hypothetical protein